MAIQPTWNGSPAHFKGAKSNPSNVQSSCKKLFSNGAFQMQTRMMVAILLLCLVLPVQAVPDADALVPYGTLRTEQFQYPNDGPRIALGATMGGLYILASHVIGKFTSWVALSMGVTSFIWVVAKNSPDVRPKHAWVIFGLWLALFLSYIAAESNRVVRPRLYIFLTLVLGWICLCITAAVQKSAMDVIAPPMASFSAFVVAFFFPGHHIHGPILPM